MINWEIVEKVALLVFAGFLIWEIVGYWKDYKELEKWTKKD